MNPATRAGLDLVIRVDESEATGAGGAEGDAAVNSVPAFKRSPQGSASSPVGWSCRRATSHTGQPGGGYSASSNDPQAGGQLGSRTSLNSGAGQSSTASLDVHAPSLPTLDSFRIGGEGRQRNTSPFFTNLNLGDAISLSCPCLMTAASGGCGTGGAGARGGGNGQQKLLPGPQLFPRASSIFDMMQHPAAPSTGDGQKLGGGGSGRFPAIDIVKGNLLNLPATISPFAFRRKANYRRKCEDWLDHMTSSSST